MSAFSAIFSEIIFKACGLERPDSDLDYRLSEDIGNLNDLASNQIYKNLKETYPLIEDGIACFPIKFHFSDAELAFQRVVSKDGDLYLEVHATDQLEQVLKLEVSIPTVLNNKDSSRKIISVLRTQKMVAPYSVVFHTEHEESMTDENFEKLALAYSLMI